MVHSIELLLDPDTEAAVRRDWTALADAGLPSLAHHRAPSNRPHVTLTVANDVDERLDDALVPLAARLPLPCRVGAPMVFGGRTLTLVRLAVPSADLLALHADVVRIASAHTESGDFPHVAPGSWTPHVTLARRMDPSDLPAALAAIGSDDVVGSFALLRHWDGVRRVDRVIERRGPG